MKKIILLLSLLVATICVSAQSARVIFISGGFSFLTDGYMSMTNLKPDDRNTKVKAEESYQYLQWNFVSGILAARITLIPITLNSSISVSAAPTISVGAIYPVLTLWIERRSSRLSGIKFRCGITLRCLKRLGIMLRSRY